MCQTNDQAVTQCLSAVTLAIRSAAAKHNRKKNSVNLIAVSKTFAATDIAPVLNAGQCHFGENRVQEALGKWPDLKTRQADVKLHLIGPLQTNKVRDAVRLFDVIHTIDRLKLARAIAGEITAQARNLDLFVQVNTGEESQKSGVPPQELGGLLQDISPLGLNVVGLMCIPPMDEDPSPHFKLLKTLALRSGLARLSMGMSHDFETAIGCGATDIRVGSAIFGPRTKRPGG